MTIERKKRNFRLKKIEKKESYTLKNVYWGKKNTGSRRKKDRGSKRDREGKELQAQKYKEGREIEAQNINKEEKELLAQKDR